MQMKMGALAPHSVAELADRLGSGGLRAPRFGPAAASRQAPTSQPKPSEAATSQAFDRGPMCSRTPSGPAQDRDFGESWPPETPKRFLPLRVCAEAAHAVAATVASPISKKQTATA